VVVLAGGQEVGGYVGQLLRLMCLLAWRWVCGQSDELQLLVLGAQWHIVAIGCCLLEVACVGWGLSNHQGWVHVVEGVAGCGPLCDGLVHQYCNEGDGKLAFRCIHGGSRGGY